MIEHYLTQGLTFAIDIYIYFLIRKVCVNRKKNKDVKNGAI